MILYRMRLHSATEYILPLTSFLLSLREIQRKPPNGVSLLEGNLPSTRETFYDPERPDKIAAERWISPMASLGQVDEKQMMAQIRSEV